MRVWMVLSVVAWGVCTGCASYEVVDVSEIVIGPGVPNQDPGVDGLAWDGVTPVPAEVFSDLIAGSADLSLDEAVAQAAAYESAFPSPTIDGSVAISPADDTEDFESCFVEPINTFDCFPRGIPRFLADGVDEANSVVITLHSKNNGPDPVATVTLDSAELNYPAGMVGEATRAFNVVAETGGAILSINTRRYYTDSR